MEENKVILTNYNIYFEVFINYTKFVFYDSSTAMSFLNNAILGCNDLSVVQSMYIIVRYESKEVQNDSSTD